MLRPSNVTILVGESEEPFSISKETLISTSKFFEEIFEEIFEGEWKEATGHPFKLLMVDEWSFETYTD